MAAQRITQVPPVMSNQNKESSSSGHYADQVVNSNCGYLSGYRKARPISEQIGILNKYDWGREIDWTLNKAQQKLLAKPVLQDSEGYFVVVFDQTMITHYEEDLSIDQSVSVTCVLEALSKQRNGGLVNYRNGKLGLSQYGRSNESAEKMKQLWKLQDCPTGIILIPAQLGIKHAGKSVLRTRAVIRESEEFPLDSFETLQMVLTHQNRLQHYDDLWINFPGSEYSPDADGVFEFTLFMGLCGDILRFDCHNTDDAIGYYGSATGFLPR